MKTKYVNRKIELLICSYGGVGTSFLIEYFSKYRICNDPRDLDTFKHLDRPPASFNPDLKAVYIYGNPYMAARSLFRRNYQKEQSRKLLRNYRSISPIPKDQDLLSYLETNVDRFKFDKHLNNWMTKSNNYPIMFVKYESLWDHLTEIFKFIGIPVSDIQYFPQKIERKSNLKQIPYLEKKLFDKMYGKFKSDIDNYEETFLIKGRNNLLILIKSIFVFLDHVLIKLLRRLKHSIQK